MNCPLCGTQLKCDVELTGGCSCPERCYCSNPDVEVSFICPNTDPWESFTKSNGKNDMRRRKNLCKQKAIVVISDRYALERYFEANYK